MKETSIIQNFCVFNIQLSHSYQIASKNENNDFFGPIHNRSQINNKFDWLFQMFLYRESRETVITVLFTKSKKKNRESPYTCHRFFSFFSSSSHLSSPRSFSCGYTRASTHFHFLPTHMPSFILVVNKHDLYPSIFLWCWLKWGSRVCLSNFW